MGFTNVQKLQYKTAFVWLSTAELAREYWQSPLNNYHPGTTTSPTEGGKRPENPPLLGAFCRPKDAHSQGVPLRLGGNLIDPCVVNLQVLWCFWHRDPYSTNGGPWVCHVTRPLDFRPEEFGSRRNHASEQFCSSSLRCIL
jgi:hypothetical protein